MSGWQAATEPSAASLRQRLMQHCLPRRVLYITGKVDSCIPPFTVAEVKETLDAATFHPKGLSVQELLAALGHWSLVVRQSAAQEHHHPLELDGQVAAAAFGAHRARNAALRCREVKP